MILAEVTSGQVALFAGFVIFWFCVLVAIFLFSFWLQKRRERGALSPYSKQPVRRASELSYWMTYKVVKFMYSFHQYDNRIFRLKKAVICRQTGRIFPDCIDWLDVIHLDWSFLQKRYPGHWVSWGSLSPEQQALVSSVHDSMADFQLEVSSPHSLPSMAEIEDMFSVPGPLYVDLETKILLGWQRVPGTDLEVLIVQKPLRIHLPNIERSNDS